MPRCNRIKADYLTYHILGRGNNKMEIFHDADDYNCYLGILRKYKKQIPFELYHYCLIMNHPHLMLKPNSDISKLMHRINLSYVLYYQNKYKYVGHLWQDRFKSLVISHDEYMMRCACYIETNPERMEHPISVDKYLYSSYRYYAFGEKSDILTRNPLYDSFGSTEEERRMNYIVFINSNKPDIEQDITKSQFFASQEYINILYGKLKDKLKRKRGRPRKIVRNLYATSCKSMS